ncbi:MAG TPA: hypothetical protein VF301_05695, partial [Ginsengibacter sp.]
KLTAIFFYALLCTFLISCWHNDHDINIAYSEYSHYYSMNAYFPKNKTRDVDEYMDDRIGRRSKMSFVNSRIDGTISLDDHTKFYIKKSPGVLEIKLDKDENSDEAYHQIKLMCQGIKKLLTK